MRPLLPLLLALPGVAQAQAMGPGTMHDGWRWWMPFPGLVWLILVVGAIVGLVLLLRSGSGSRSSAGRRSALDVLDERYARGEIEREEYLRRKDDLTAPPGEQPHG